MHPALATPPLSYKTSGNSIGSEKLGKLIPYKHQIWGLRGKTPEMLMTAVSYKMELCLEAEIRSSAPPSSSSSCSIGQVHTQTPVTHLDELSTVKQHVASSFADAMVFLNGSCLLKTFSFTVHTLVFASFQLCKHYTNISTYFFLPLYETETVNTCRGTALSDCLPSAALISGTPVRIPS